MGHGAHFVGAWATAEGFRRSARSSSALPAFLDAFKRAGIPYAVEIERHFYGAPEVGDLLNLLRALDNPDDRIAVTGLLRSPLAALSDDGLLTLARAGALDYLKDPRADLAEGRASRRRSPVQDLASLRARAGRTPLGEFVSAALAQTRLPELAARAYHGQQTVSNLLKLQRLAAEASESRGATLKDFVAEVQESARESRREGGKPARRRATRGGPHYERAQIQGLNFPWYSWRTCRRALRRETRRRRVPTGRPTAPLCASGALRPASRGAG